MQEFMQGFIDFMQEYGVIGLAIGVVIGNTTKDLVNAVVNDILMPLIGILLPSSEWQNYTVQFMTAELQVGHLLSAFLDFLLIAFLIYAFVKLVLRKKEIKKM
ncbi:MAG: MscL family protein [Candidatus Nanohaloarchaea archaeon]|nr:MscL family protein [Candidatus Nanohaloarchaea archaeon]